MRTVNDILQPSDFYALGRSVMWLNNALHSLGKMMTTPRTTINIHYEPVEYTSTNGLVWNCEHASTRKQDVIFNHDDAELATICDSCDAQLIGEEWVTV